MVAWKVGEGCCGLHVHAVLTLFHIFVRGDSSPGTYSMICRFGASVYKLDNLPWTVISFAACWWVEYWPAENNPGLGGKGEWDHHRGCEHPVPVLWHVEDILCLAHWRHGPVQHQLPALRRTQVLVQSACSWHWSFSGGRGLLSSPVPRKRLQSSLKCRLGFSRLRVGVAFYILNRLPSAEMLLELWCSDCLWSSRLYCRGQGTSYHCVQVWVGRVTEPQRLFPPLPLLSAFFFWAGLRHFLEADFQG